MCGTAPMVPGSKVAQAGGDVLAVIVNLLRVEGALAVQAIKRLLELHQLSLASLPIQTLVTDILQKKKTTTTQYETHI